MSYTKRILTPLAMATLAVVNAGLVRLDNADATPGTGGWGSWLPTSGWVETPGTTCAEAQNAINRVNGSGEIRIIEDCAANLIIPSGKTISLTMYSKDENGQQVFHHLTDNGGDTITVQSGAAFYYESSDTPEEYIANSTAGKSMINNQGYTTLLTGNYKATNGAYLFTNSGELNIMGNNFTGTSIRNTGKIRVLGGTYDNYEVVKPYMVKGARIDEANNRITTDGADPTQAYIDALTAFADKKLPVGYEFMVKTDYSEHANALEVKLESSNPSVFKVSGSNDEGWTFTVVGTGSATLQYRAIYQGAAADVATASGFEIDINTTGDNKGLLKYLVKKHDSVMQQALNRGEDISVDLNVNAKGNTVNTEDAQKIANVAGADKIAGYYDISLALNGNGRKLANLTDLEDGTVDISLTDFAKNLEGVKPGYTRSYYVVRVHNGVAEKIDTRLENNKLTFKSGKFSTYAVAYNDTKTSSGNNDSNGISSDTNSAAGTPDTGVVARSSDNGSARVATTGIVVFVVASSLAAAIVIIRKRQQSEK